MEKHSGTSSDKMKEMRDVPNERAIRATYRRLARLCKGSPPVHVTFASLAQIPLLNPGTLTPAGQLKHFRNILPKGERSSHSDLVPIASSKSSDHALVQSTSNNELN